MKGLIVPFAKMHGLGNDFIIVRRHDLPLTGTDGERAIRWCDRRTGIGADGLLIVSDENRTSFCVQIINQDGSSAEICGNGIRCAVLDWARKQRRAEADVLVHTDAGTRHARLDLSGLVSVEMGPAILIDQDLPEANLSRGLATITIPFSDASWMGYALSMGNPHLVLFDPPTCLTTSERAEKLQHHPGFRRGANVSFARVVDPETIQLVVWERGCGFTKACGTAACATVAAAVATGQVSASTPIRVRLPGGDLLVKVAPDLSNVTMTGPAVHVFSGRIGTRFF